MRAPSGRVDEGVEVAVTSSLVYEQIPTPRFTFTFHYVRASSQDQVRILEHTYHLNGHNLKFSCHLHIVNVIHESYAHCRCSQPELSSD